MSIAYDLVKASGYDWIGWFDISIKPPNTIYILVNIKEWGCAVGRLSNDNKAFIFSLPHEDSPTYLTMPIDKITHWAIIPELKDRTASEGK